MLWSKRNARLKAQNNSAAWLFIVSVFPATVFLTSALHSSDYSSALCRFVYARIHRWNTFRAVAFAPLLRVDTARTARRPTTENVYCGRQYWPCAQRVMLMFLLVLFHVRRRRGQHQKFSNGQNRTVKAIEDIYNTSHTIHNNNKIALWFVYCLVAVYLMTLF